jgi:predicted AlkP superfamily pyrophosphatase or phosphodiesterase
VVDQLAAWVMAERAQELPANGGLARLGREGLYVREMEFQHAVTETAPGHAALFTGRVPRETGIY